MVYLFGSLLNCLLLFLFLLLLNFFNLFTDKINFFDLTHLFFVEHFWKNFDSNRFTGVAAVSKRWDVVDGGFMAVFEFWQLVFLSKSILFFVIVPIKVVHFNFLLVIMELH